MRMLVPWLQQGGARMTRAIQCTTCRWFDAWAPNPSAAVGRCLHDARHGYFFASEWHRCNDHSLVAVPKAEAAIDE